MFNETSYFNDANPAPGDPADASPPRLAWKGRPLGWQGRSRPLGKGTRFLGPPLQDSGVVHNVCAPTGMTNSIPAQYIYPSGCPTPLVESPGYQAPGPAQPGPTDAPQSANGAPVAGGFDFGSLLSGDIMGIPTWLVLGGAAWFFFFRKGR